MNALLTVIAFYLGMLTQYLIYRGIMRLRRQSLTFRTPQGWHEIQLFPPEDLAEATLLWQQAIGGWEN